MGGEVEGVRARQPRSGSSPGPATASARGALLPSEPISARQPTEGALSRIAGRGQPLVHPPRPSVEKGRGALGTASSERYVPMTGGVAGAPLRLAQLAASDADQIQDSTMTAHEDSRRRIAEWMQPVVERDARIAWRWRSPVEEGGRSRCERTRLDPSIEASISASLGTSQARLARWRRERRGGLHLAGASTERREDRLARGVPARRLGRAAIRGRAGRGNRAAAILPGGDWLPLRAG